MISIPELATALTGAWRLAQLDRRGAAQFDATVDGFWKSFTAAAILLPLHFILKFMEPEDIAAPLWREVAIIAIAYVITWVAYPLVMAGITELIDRRSRYLGYIVAVNWCSVLQTALFVPFYVAGLYGGAAGQILYLIVFLAMLAFDWFIARVMLDIDGLTAAGLVLLSLLLSAFIALLSDGLITGA